MKELINNAGELKKLQAENAALRLENRQLYQHVVRTPKHSHRRTIIGSLRTLAAVVLLSLAVILVLLGNLLFWLGNTVVKQDRYVAAVGPLIKDPAVQHAVALYTTNQLFSNADVEQVVTEALPPRADFLAPQLTTQLKSRTETVLNKALDSSEVQTAWQNINQRQHDRLVTFAANYQGDGVINLNDLYNSLGSKLKDTKLAFLADKKLPAGVGEITVVDAPWLPVVHTVVTRIDTWRLLALLLMILALAGAVLLSRRRRRTIYVFALAVAVAMLVTLTGLKIAAETIAGQADPLYAEGVRHAVRIVTQSLVLQTIVILLTAVFIAFVAWVSGPSKSAFALRIQGVQSVSGRLHKSIMGSHTNHFVGWVQRRKPLLQWLVVGALTAFWLATPLTIGSLLLYVLLLLVLVLVIEVIGARPRRM